MTMTRMVIRAALGLSCLFLAHCSSPPVGSEFTGPPSAPRPCVLLQASTPNPHQDLGEQSAGGESEGSGGWQWGSAGAQGSLTVAQGCVLTLWGEQGGHQSFPSGTRVPLEGWERPLALHCSCEEEEGWPRREGHDKPPCRYRASKSKSFIIIACKNNEPVHLDGHDEN
ncbi:hypothetical protein MATL_G00167480 [Megalops atlanticus]|uniref:Ribonuclease A-domain domain-containing protein n=1 Tax=Megalops atlanticus TaxID=7932 RepID=A0A9D3PT56_MEGAT|nr:hypothetical protein MATL_G00167480 [Megalops atlanticus]